MVHLGNALVAAAQLASDGSSAAAAGGAAPDVLVPSTLSGTRLPSAPGEPARPCRRRRACPRRAARVGPAGPWPIVPLRRRPTMLHGSASSRMPPAPARVARGAGTQPSTGRTKLMTGDETRSKPGFEVRPTAQSFIVPQHGRSHDVCRPGRFAPAPVPGIRPVGLKRIQDGPRDLTREVVAEAGQLPCKSSGTRQLGAFRRERPGRRSRSSRTTRLESASVRQLSTFAEYRAAPPRVPPPPRWPRASGSA